MVLQIASSILLITLFLHPDCIVARLTILSFPAPLQWLLRTAFHHPAANVISYSSFHFCSAAHLVPRPSCQTHAASAAICGMSAQYLRFAWLEGETRDSKAFLMCGGASEACWCTPPSQCKVALSVRYLDVFAFCDYLRLLCQDSSAKDLVENTISVASHYAWTLFRLRRPHDQSDAGQHANDFSTVRKIAQIAFTVM